MNGVARHVEGTPDRGSSQRIADSRRTHGIVHGVGRLSLVGKGRPHGQRQP
ncbi:hypothetical protein B005_0477 [Nocardiopsis alba ATCC BAA-2165]|uniref:Uncharacterized protein n=1 Tax=Nocardiopsis alba (strain ATCC BAA-2165 / BE74) TaxID=1205910 RepID=J7LGW2_NOCAA|nr:hypothetical protein B005_0477 [Nocardiopsis alba ATCC BAA-2165]